MSKDSKHPSDAVDQNKLGPDYFSYFTRRVTDLLSQEDILPNPPNNSVLFGACPSFGDSIGAKFSDLKKGELNALLRQSAEILTKEVDQMLEPALSIDHLRSLLRAKRNLVPVNKVASNNVEQALSMEPKSSSSPSSLSASEDYANLGSSKVMESELLFFLENDSMQVEEIVTKFSNELSGTLGHMEQQLEKLLDTVMSKSRPMILKEKQQLQKLIQQLPPENLDRVAEIIQNGRSDKTDSSDEIHIDLDKENNVTLWRLYYYVEAVKEAKKLALR